MQEFVRTNGSEARVEISAAELSRKRAMCAEYVSQQGEFLQSFDLAREVVRPQARYDYGRAPHEGRTNYECWGWWMSAREVSARLAEFLESGRLSGRNQAIAAGGLSAAAGERRERGRGRADSVDAGAGAGGARVGDRGGGLCGFARVSGG